MLKQKIFTDTDLPQTEKLNLYLNIIAHELRNPLVSIRGYTELIRDEMDNMLPPKSHEYFQRIENCIGRAESLLSGISKLAKVTISEGNFDKVAAHDLVDAALELHRFSLLQKGLQLKVQPNLPALYCDTDSMILVFSNLIGNAIKYSQDGPGGPIQVGYLDDEIFHKFYVKDEGVGFKARDHSKVFLLFSRLRNKKNVDGSGLGLSIVKQIIEGHGGEIWAESRQNKGATFFFTLPKNFPQFS